MTRSTVAMLPGLSGPIALTCCSLLLLTAGCASSQKNADPGVENAALESSAPWEDTDHQTVEAPARLEDCWGPGRTIGLMTGTWASKDRNFAVNVPLASWYVRKEDRKGYGLLGGALAYDTVSVDRVGGRPVTKNLFSHGILGLFGRIEKRDLEGSGQYAKHHWCFPFYRYQNKNGERTVYPLFLFPWSLEPDPRPLLEVPPWEQNAHAMGDPIDPPEVRIPPAPPPESVSLQPALPRNPRSPDSSLESMTEMLKESREERARRAAQRRARTVAPVSPVSRAPAETPPRTSPARGSWQSTERSTPQPAAAIARTYRVQKGDTLYSIARSEYGDAGRWRAILDANRDRIPDPDRIGAGLVLRLP